MNAAGLKYRLVPSIFLMLASCAPIQAATEATLPTPTQTKISPSQTLPVLSTSTSTATPLPPTITSVPCDPLTADFCIIDGNFILQRPILPPANASVDISYRYGTTAKQARDPHHGVEFMSKFGTPVHAAGDGEVVFAGLDEIAIYSPWRIFYGNVVVIRHANELYTLYAHLSRIDVFAGQQVMAGEKLGEIGQTGAAIGSHLHFEVRRGGDGTDYFSTENPERWLIPKEGTGALSITLVTAREMKFERDIVISSDERLPIYVFTYTKGFEHNVEDAVITDLPAGIYKIAFYEMGVMYERQVEVRAGQLTETLFVAGQ
ncbi:MAG: M23 family metallopeptidase [Anaerolineales bacterium]|nr:M23 family metallopeptidase [Anaerolineales bacterium]